MNDEINKNEELKQGSEEKKKAEKKKLRGKKYQTSSKLIKKEFYNLEEALKLLKETKYENFDSSIDLHFNLSIDPTRSDQLIRINSSLPHGIKKEVKILVFGNEDQLKKAKEAGAMYLGDTETINKIKNGWVDFDKVLASPEMMPKIAPLARILGPKGLMPNTKNNTITTDFEKTISTLVSGTSVEIKNEKDFPIVHVRIGKTSFEEKALKENIRTVYLAMQKAKPNKVKLPYIKSLTITTTMSPGINIDLNTL